MVLQRILGGQGGQGGILSGLDLPGLIWKVIQGQEEAEDAIWSAMQIAGRTVPHEAGGKGYPSVMEVRLLRGTLLSAKASLRLTLNGTVVTTPRELVALSAFFAAAAKGLEEPSDPEDKDSPTVYEAALAEESGLNIAGMFTKAVSN